MGKLTNGWIDWESQYYITMSPEHHGLHEGWNFITSMEVTIPANSSIYLHLKTPNSIVDTTMKGLNVICDKNVKVQAYESPTITSQGTTESTLIQRNRKMTDRLTAETKIYTDTVATGGTLLRTWIFGSGGSKSSTTSPSEDTGFNFKKDSHYYMKFTNLDAQPTTFCCISGYIYEIRPARF